MGDCIVLNDTAVHEILVSLSKDEILIFIDSIATALKNISVNGDHEYQPSASIVNRPDGRKNLFRLFTSSTGVGAKIIVDPSRALANEEPSASEARRNRLTSLHGVLALCDQNGYAAGFINAEELTGRRTFVSAMLLYTRRKDTTNIVVFGAGKQALWHSRLALALRGEEIKKITYINRSAERTKHLLEQIKKENEAQWKTTTVFEGIVLSTTSHDERLIQVLSQADVIFCTRLQSQHPSRQSP
jgi:ornithine cyclodeaminase/alanine dehydrogenase-like protein (mu-crystallin family)